MVLASRRGYLLAFGSSDDGVAACVAPHLLQVAFLCVKKIVTLYGHGFTLEAAAISEWLVAGHAPLF